MMSAIEDAMALAVVKGAEQSRVAIGNDLAYAVLAVTQDAS
jgi:hypothetical protein